MTVESFIAADQQILGFLNAGHSLFLDNLATILTTGWVWVPLYLTLFFLVVKNNETMTQIALVLGCSVLCVLLSGGLDDLVVKPLVSRLRPCNDPSIKYTLTLVAGCGERDFSFFSAHAANTMALAMFFCLLVRDKVLSSSLFIWSLLNAWTRLYLGLHFPSDVMAGLLWGGISGALAYLVFYKLYMRISPKLNYISTQYTRTGYSRLDIDVVMTVLVLTLLAATLCALLAIGLY